LLVINSTHSGCQKLTPSISPKHSYTSTIDHLRKGNSPCSQINAVHPFIPFYLIGKGGLQLLETLLALFICSTIRSNLDFPPESRSVAYPMQIPSMCAQIFSPCHCKSVIHIAPVFSRLRLFLTSLSCYITPLKSANV
jgi:hypothetical protein